MKKVITILIVAIISLFTLVLHDLISYNDGKLHVVVCDVGQGDAIFITTPASTQILIDGGPDRSVLNCLDKNMPFWDRSIDAIILSHPHADHLMGLIDVLDRYDIGEFYVEDVPAESKIYKLLEARLADKKLSAKVLFANEKFSEKIGFKIQIYWPRLKKIKEVDHNSTDLDLNGLSIISKIAYGNFTMLLTGDSNSKVLYEIANEVGDLDIFMFPHHGSKTSASESFLNITKPELAIISVGENNTFGHPSKTSLGLLKNYKTQVLRTDKNGEIEIVSNGKTYLIKSSKN